jgi:hypothetical protein
MTVIYAAPLAPTTAVVADRATFRLSLAKRNGVAFTAGVVSWPNTVETVVSAIGHSGTARALGYARPPESADTAVIEVMSPTNPGSGLSVGDIVRAAENASSFARVTRIEKLPPVPVIGSTAEAERNAARDAEAARAAASAESSSIVTRVANALGTGVTLTKFTMIGAAAVSLAVVAVLIHKNLTVVRESLP